ncbi:hypothetical protein D3C85_1884590 [compost metagenome]
MPVALRMLAMNEEALRCDDVEMILGAGHRHVKQAAFLLDLGCRSDAEIGWDATVDAVQQEDRAPFLSFSRVNG